MPPLKPSQLTAFRRKLKYCYFSDSRTGCEASPMLFPTRKLQRACGMAFPRLPERALHRLPDWFSSFRCLFLKGTEIPSQDTEREKGRKLSIMEASQLFIFL